jgi:hypothetical protein
MSARDLIANAVRRMDVLFPGFFPTAKHNHYRDFGWPESLDFSQLYAMYQRNGLANAAVNKTILKTWEDAPTLWETEKPAESQIEADIRQRFADLRLWQRFAEADKRAMVGGYSGIILRLADGKRFQEPVDAVPGGLQGLVEVIPAWAGQLTVSTWDTDETSETYGQPSMFSFNEAQVPTATGVAVGTQTRSFSLHPDRVIIWSEDGTVHPTSALAAGYNDLMNLEKVAGAGGEGFWKNAKSAPVLSVDKETRLNEMAQAMGVSPDEIADVMNEQVADWQSGFDKLLMLQGMKAETLSVTLPSPEHFFNISLQSFAASMHIPLKILVGNQTGERASTEDARDWSITNMARRNNLARPGILEFTNRLERFMILPERDWTIGWSDLTESSTSEKLDRAEKMSSINQKSRSGPLGSEVIFTGPEIREAVGYEPLPDAERFGEMAEEFGDTI